MCDTRSMTGKVVSHYRVLEPLGEGGMGVVYKAEDTRLKRTVALKFLSSEVTGGGEFKERFLREAQASAALDHPNICTVYEIDEVEGQTFLSMAFLEGEALDRIVEKGPLPLDRAIAIAVQAAEGLAAAHAQGVVHRDVKSANMIVREDTAGRPVVKLMDFGLAQMSGRSKLTQVDTRLGTVAYMSPEQTQGGTVDRRSDLWSLGVVIYEMVAGELPFKGHYDQAVMYSILNEEPAPLTSLRGGVPMELEWIVEKCLAKNANDRYQNGRELVVDLERLQRRIDSGKSVVQPLPAAGRTAVGIPAQAAQRGTPLPAVLETQAAGEVAGAAPRSADRLRMLRLERRVKALAAAAAVLAAALPATWALRSGASESADEPLRKFSLRPANILEHGQSIGHLAVSPDGRQIAFTTTGSRGALWLQSLDRLEPRQVEGAEDARFVFWSPDSLSIGFTTDRSVKKAALRGGSVTTLAEIGTRFFGGAPASWSPDGNSVLLGHANGFPFEIPALGGTPKPLFDPGTGERPGYVRAPQILEDSRGRRLLLYSQRTLDGETIMMRRLSEDGAGTAVRLAEGSYPTYSNTGHVLYQPSSATAALWALPVSLDEAQAVGEAFPIAEDGSAASVAENGTLVYLDNPFAGPKQLVWLDRSGERVGAIGKPQPWIMAPRVSPDGAKLVVSAGSAQVLNVWVHDASRPVMNRLSFEDGEETDAIWSPDGTRVAFARRGSPDVFVQNIGGGGKQRVIFSAPGDLQPLDWSRDGQFILFRMRVRRGAPGPGAARKDGAGQERGDMIMDRLMENSVAARKDGAGQERGGAGISSGIGYLRQVPDEERWEAQQFLEAGRFIADGAVFSPNGRYVAYVSNESGEFEVYVKRFPATEERWQISTDGGSEPRWNPNGRELFFVRDETLYAAAVGTERNFTVGETVPLFSRASLRRSRRFSSYDVGPDGRFAVVALAEGPPQPAIRVVLNWFAEFQPR